MKTTQSDGQPDGQPEGQPDGPPQPGDLGESGARAVPGVEDLVLLLDQLPAMVGYWDRDGRNIFANAAYIDWFGVSPGELHGRHIRDLMGPELYALNEPYIMGALAGERQQFERTLVDAGGVTRYVQAEYIPNWVAGVPTGFFVLVTDISTRVRAEKTLQETVRQVALLEERQRIAADLHDVVIQRLFAAGIDLSAAMRQGPDAVRRLESAAEGVDAAIRELRGAIHSLRELMVPTQVPASIEKILGNAGRVLGFMPTMTYTGSLEVLPEAAVQDLLAVLNEALSNVARHAGATRVEVSLACTDEQVLLRVADDGRGLHHAERSSGLSNMRHRAERLGGTFVCAENQPRGTIVEWMVPASRV